MIHCIITGRAVSAQPQKVDSCMANKNVEFITMMILQIRHRANTSITNVMRTFMEKVMGNHGILISENRKKTEKPL